MMILQRLRAIHRDPPPASAAVAVAAAAGVGVAGRALASDQDRKLVNNSTMVIYDAYFGN